MYQFSPKALKLIEKEAKGKKFLKLNIGVMIGEQTMIKTFGENGEIEYENNIYEIGSIGKTFTASLLAKFVHEKKVQLGDSINKYIHDLDSDKYYPSLKRLATHTSGYTEYQLTTWYSIKMLVDTLLKKFKMLSENHIFMDYDKMLKDILKNRMEDRDYKCSYSNFGMSVLGYVLGVVSGLGYWDTMDDFVKNELGLSNTYLGTLPDKNLNGFSPKNEKWGNWKWDKNNLMVPAGAFSSTAEDLLKYAKMNMYEEKDYFPLCHQKYSSINKQFDIGLGWWLDKKNNNIVMHSGTTGCFDTFLGFDKENKIAVAFLPNYRWGIASQMVIGPMIIKDIQKCV
jgi:CubicO group peptidase (beta-lactamase class C family)